MASALPPEVFAALQGSGFPFQTAVRQVIGAKPQAGWSLFRSEYAWQTLDGEGRFLDLVAIKDGQLFITVECKKTISDVWTFLRPLGHAHTGSPHVDFRCLRAEQIGGGSAKLTPPKHLKLHAETWPLAPPSTVSEFCVISGRQTDRLLEKHAGELIRATDAFADDIRKGCFQTDPHATFHLFIPVIVTNATLFTARYNPTEVSLVDGRFAEPPKEIEPCEVVRFQKTFMSEGWSDLRERSVFVVYAPAFSTFLDQLALTGNRSGYPHDRVPFVRGERQRT